MCLWLWMFLSDVCSPYGRKAKKGRNACCHKQESGALWTKKIELPMESITAIPFQDRTTLEDLARRLGVSKSHVHRLLKEGKIERHSSAIKPFLTL
ncbi:hypothetical protein PVAP13_2NG117692 [Panicum virgatum]|uniref:HTH iclR-type domain-containing protein n=1 Tax=Panicum virgatum TaxID=38727 RepID=A0A8T0V705_PANVG|nr:hypothetical protein PVAP13_2NG117692 [Panicum virgatum]